MARAYLRPARPPAAARAPVGLVRAARRRPLSLKLFLPFPTPVRWPPSRAHWAQCTRETTGLTAGRLTHGHLSGEQEGGRQGSGADRRASVPVTQPVGRRTTTRG